MRWVVRSALGLALISAVLLGLARWRVERQGGALEDAVRPGSGTSITLDAHGVPTIRASSWLELLEAEGYHVASQRMFQMELMRRSATGRLSALFGEKALPIDRRRMEEDWPTVVARAYDELPSAEREAIDAYARGVTRFVETAQGRWGIEFELLRVAPEPWRGSDTLAVLLTMCEELSSSAPLELMEGRWRAAISDREWLDLLFSRDHPWNVPLFGVAPPPPRLPSRALPREPLGPREGLAAAPRAPDELAPSLRAMLPMGLPPHDGPTPASNSWAYCGAAGCWLANDPHLGYSVPQLWYALRLEVGAEWAVGVAIPGIPGLVLGQNAELAWSFTNTGEDVDDLLAETLSPDRSEYLAGEDEDGEEVWAPLRVKTATIVVKDAPPVHVRVEHTHRGPLLTRPGMVTDHTRQWLPLKPGMLRIPIGIPRAKTIDEVERALDGMRAPAQNVTIVDRAGNIGYRTSGTGIRRRQPGSVPMRALDGEWLGFLDPSTRPRLRIASTSTAPRILVTANQRIWVDDGAHAWADDARDERIRRALHASDRLAAEDMARLQLDTESRYHRWLLEWVGANARAKSAPEHWKGWDGVADARPRAFTEALAIDAAAQEILLGRVRKHLAGGAELAYSHRLARAWMLVTLTSTDGLSRFGVDAPELADRLIEVAAKIPATESYATNNRWEAQHPFVGRAPALVARWFEISTPAQVGHRALVRTEAPKFGASVRLVWSAADPTQSRWSFPVGQSGHVASPHYDEAREDWFHGRFRPAR